MIAEAVGSAIVVEGGGGIAMAHAGGLGDGVQVIGEKRSQGGRQTVSKYPLVSQHLRS